MDIIILEPLNHFAIKLYQGSRWRYASMTDVKFLDDQHIIVAHRYSCKVYSIHIDYENKLFTIIDSIQLVRNNKPYQTESFVIVNNIIYMLSYSNIMSFIDILPNYHLQQKDTFLKLVNENIPFHGITRKNHLLYVTPSNKQIGTEYILAINTLNHQVHRVASLGPNARVKSLVFLTGNLIVALINYKEDTSMTDKTHIFNGEIRLYSDKYVLLDCVYIESTHFDCSCNDQCTFYATGANLHNGYIYVGRVHDERIQTLYGYEVYDFPHGIDFLGNTIAYTSYSTSGVHFIDKSTLCKKNDKAIIYR
jgi:hypothetical protein